MVISTHFNHIRKWEVLWTVGLASFTTISIIKKFELMRFLFHADVKCMRTKMTRMRNFS